jgi:hypothetical protein
MEGIGKWRKKARFHPNILKEVLGYIILRLMRPIPGYENKYYISNAGNICTNKRFLIPYEDSAGHPHVRLSHRKSEGHHRVCRLVAELYCENPHDYKFIQHIDGNIRNNHPSNLEWCEDREKVRERVDLDSISGKPIPLFEENTLVTEEGTVIKDSYIVPPSVDKKSGCYKVFISSGNLSKSYFVHRLVAELYVDNPEEFSFVRHIDGDVRNNHYSNLRWVRFKKDMKRGVTKITPEFEEQEETSQKVSKIPSVESHDHSKDSEDEKEIFVPEEEERDSFTIHDFPAISVDREGNVFQGRKRIHPYLDTHSGTLRISLRKEKGRTQEFFLHRLVAQFHVENPHNYLFVKHINGDVLDNRAENLIWVESRWKVNSERALPKDKKFEQIPSFEDYFITREGEVYSLKSGRYLKIHELHGYKFVRFHDSDGKGKDKFIHKLLGETFLEKGPEHTCVNHINGNPLDNRLENLEWTTKSEDVKHAYRTGLNPGRNKEVIQIEITYRVCETKTYCSLGEASKATGVSRGAICTACQDGKDVGTGRKPLKDGVGYRFSYAEDKVKEGVARKIKVRKLLPVETEIARFKSIVKASRETGTEPNTITSCCRGVDLATFTDGKKYTWRYVKEDVNPFKDCSIEESELEWRDIPGYPDYKLSEKGDVYSEFYKRNLEAGSKKDGGGKFVKMTDENGERKVKYISALLREVFP